MQKRSKRFGLIGIAALVLCLAAAMFLVSGCSEEPEETSEATLAPLDKEPSNAGKLPTEPFYVLIVGNDSRADTAEDEGNTNSFSDTIMLARVDPVNYQVTTVSIARDTQIWIDGEKVKMNDSYSRGGINALIDQVEALTGARAEYYFDMGFADFIKFVDALGGITVNVPVDMTFKDVMSDDDITLYAGDQSLDGRAALVFSRVRKIFADDHDACRQTDDRSVVTSILQSVANNPDTIEKAVSALYDNAETNWTKEDFEALVKDFADHADQLKVLSGTGPYVGDIDEETQLWMVIRDDETWQQLMDVVNAGGDPNEVVEPPVLALG